MKFEEALAAFRNGKSIARGTYEDGMHGGINKNSDCELHLIDILAEDWFIWEKPGKSFPEVFYAFKEGKWIRRKSWETDHYLPFKKINNQTIGISFFPEELLKNDWEVIE